MSGESIESNLVVIETVEDISNKRTLGDTSFDQSLSPGTPAPESKRSNTEPSVPNTSVTSKLVTEDVLIANLESMFQRFESKIDLKFAHLESRLESFDLRISELEQNSSSQNIRIENLLSRAEDIEQQGADVEQRLASVESSRSATDESWQPAGTPDTNILLLGDSNSGGKIKFGQEKGTLGRALPGFSEFCPKLENLPPSDSPLYNSVSDVMISVGTNNIKTNSSDPETMVKLIYNYVKSVTRKYPSIHVLLPGVLPVHCAYEDQALNVKIKLYNHYLQDMCNHLNRVHFIDVNVFCDLNGSLKPHLSKGDRDPLHLNEQGIKLFASRFKYALRVHHNLPQAPRRSFHPAPVSNSAGNYQVAPPLRGSRGGRGSHSYRRDTPGTRFKSS